MKQKENIKKLLEKYLEGESSLKEEKQLRYYFLFEEVDPEFESYKALFQFYENEKQVKFTETPKLKEYEKNASKTILLSYWKIVVAAVLILGIGITWYVTNQDQAIESLNHKEVLIAQKYLSMSLETLDKNFVRSAELLNNTKKIEESTQKVRKMSDYYSTQRNQLNHLEYIDQSFKKLENIKSIQKSRIKLIM